MKKLAHILTLLGAAATVTTASAQVTPALTIRVAVGGEVTRPGSLDLRPNATLVAALVGAGGFTIVPDRAIVKIYRTDGQSKIYSVDAEALLERNDPSQNLRLHNGDLVMVSKVEVKPTSAPEAPKAEVAPSIAPIQPKPQKNEKVPNWGYFHFNGMTIYNVPLKNDK